VAKPPRGMNLGGLNTSQPKRAARWLGLDPSVRVTKARFRGIDSEYWSRWCSSGFGYEVYRDWLDSVMRQISAELATIWKGKSDVTDRWFQNTCGPAVEKALSALVKQRIAQARDVESKRLERAPSSNPILDEIRTGGDNLSPAAQRAIALSGVSPTAVALRPVGPGEPVAPEGALRGPVTNDAKSDDGRPESAVLPARVVAPAGSVPDSAPVLNFHEVLTQTSQEVARAVEGADLSQLSVMAQEAARAFEGTDLNPELVRAVTETATVKLDPELLKSLEAATVGFESTRNALAGLDWSAVAAALEANQADMDRMDRALGVAVPLTPRNRDEEVELLHRFSTDQKGLGLTEEQFSELQTASQWLEHFHVWERSRLNATRAKGRGGRPPKDQTRDIHEAWLQMGKPEITWTVSDRIAKLLFPIELKTAPLGSPQRKNLRERIRQAVKRVERRAAT
jgi:hypothetical protein